MKTWIFKMAAMCAFTFSGGTGNPALPESRTVVNNKRRSNYKDQTYWIILGALVIGSYLFYINYLFPGYWQFYSYKPGTVLIEPFIIHWPAINYPYYWMYGFLGTGIMACVCGLVQIRIIANSDNFRNHDQWRKILAVIQMLVGIGLIAWMLLYLIKVEPEMFPDSIKAAVVNGSQIPIFHDRQWERGLLFWKIVNFVIGFSMTGLGIRTIKDTGLRRS